MNTHKSIHICYTVRQVHELRDLISTINDESTKERLLLLTYDYDKLARL